MSDPCTQVLAELNADLTRKNIEANRKIDELEKQISELKTALARPAIAVMTNDQVGLLAQILTEQMGDLRKKEYVN